MMTHENAEDVIARLFIDRCTPDEWTSLFGHLRECARCRARYDERRASSLVAEGRAKDDPYLSTRELDVATALGLARFTAARRARRLRAVAAGTVVAASLLGVVLFMHTRDPQRVDPSSGFQARGDDAFGAQILCFQKDDLDRPSTLKASGRCPPGSVLKVQASSLDPHVNQVVAVVLGEGFEKLGVFRAKLEGHQSVTLHGHADIGSRKQVAVVIAFSWREQPEGVLDAALQRAAAGGAQISTLRGLELDGVGAQKVYLVSGGEP